MEEIKNKTSDQIWEEVKKKLSGHLPIDLLFEVRGMIIDLRYAAKREGIREMADGIRNMNTNANTEGENN